MVRPLNILTFMAIPLIVLTALFQGLGFFQQLEMEVMRCLPSHVRPSPPKVIQLILETSPEGFSSMDMAMSLRGLTQCHPRCVLVNGRIEPEKGSVPLLPGIIVRMSNNTNITLVIPQAPAPEVLFRAVPRSHYSYPLLDINFRWPLLLGKSVPGSGAAYLPDHQDPKDSLPLLSKTSDGSSVGSLWWWGLPQSVITPPPFLLGKSRLFFGNRALIHLTPTGGVPIAEQGGEVLEMQLDDFLLQIEQKERGSISPAFDAIWKDSTVIIGTNADTSKVSTYASLLREISFKRLPLWSQMLMTLGWIVLFLLIRNSHFGIDHLPCWLLSLLITLIVIFTTLFLMHTGIVIPFLQGIVTAFLICFCNSNKR